MQYHSKKTMKEFYYRYSSENNDILTEIKQFSCYKMVSSGKLDRPMCSGHRHIKDVSYVDT